jgi:hypothetical protein
VIGPLSEDMQRQRLCLGHDNLLRWAIGNTPGNFGISAIQRPSSISISKVKFTRLPLLRCSTPAFPIMEHGLSLRGFRLRPAALQDIGKEPAGIAPLLAHHVFRSAGDHDFAA